MPVREDLAAEVMRILRHGDFQADMSDAIAECVKAADEHGKDSALTVKLKFKAKRGQVLIEDDIVSKPARPNNPPTIAFNDVHGNLTRHDPRQQSMDLKTVEEDDRALKRMEDEYHG